MTDHEEMSAEERANQIANIAWNSTRERRAIRDEARKHLQAVRRQALKEAASLAQNDDDAERESASIIADRIRALIHQTEKEG